MRVKFHGAAGEVTGSCHEVEAAGKRILLDCGMIQGSDEDEARNADDFSFDAADLDAVVLSHAHIDHCGRLPLLVKRGFRGSIWTQPATADLLPVMLEDAASLAEMDAERDNRHRRNGQPKVVPLFNRHDVGQVMRQVKHIDYGHWQEIQPRVRVRLSDAGHILGAAIVELWADEGEGVRKLVFSGDIGPHHTPILRDPTDIHEADLVIMESTYGGRTHRGRDATIEEMGKVFEQAWREGGNVLIPAFAVGRSQELLYWFAKYWEEWGLSRWKIYLDSPMASKVVAVYDRHQELFDEEAKKVWREKPNPFKLPNLQYSVEVAQSQAINEHKGGAIIIAGSGMCNGGRIRHHLRQNLGRKNAHVIFVGYQGVGTLGRRLVDGAAQVRIFGEEISVKAQRHTVGGLSAHTDHPGLMRWYGQFKDKPPVLLVHGEDEARNALADDLRKTYGCEAVLALPEMRRSV